MSSAIPQDIAPQARVGRIVSRSDARGMRSIALAVVVHNPQRAKLVLRLRFGTTAVTTAVTPFENASTDSEEYNDALGLRDMYGADPSNLVLVVSAYEPGCVPEEDKSDAGLLPIAVEVLTKDGPVLCQVQCGFSFCPSARRYWNPHSLSPSIPPHAATEPSVHVDFLSSTPELLPSSSSSSSTSDSASTPPSGLNEHRSPDPLHSVDPKDPQRVAGTVGPRAPMTFKRTTQLDKGEHGIPAVLRLQGDISLMAHGWDTEELDVKRRIVLCRAEHRGRESLLTFSPQSQDQYCHDTPNPSKGTSALGFAYISCIYDEVRDECVITSVDLILLLEVIFHVAFETDEKNRIRRNLEALHPRAVIKCRPETEALFSLIMEFPDPKPRSIEKSVKVFKWSSLEDALNKIISKFSGVRPKPATALASPATCPQTNQKRSPSRSSHNLRNSKRSIRGTRRPSATHGPSPLVLPTQRPSHPVRISENFMQTGGPVLVQTDPADFRMDCIPALDLPALYDARRSASPFVFQLPGGPLPVDNRAHAVSPFDSQVTLTESLTQTERLVGFGYKDGLTKTSSGSEPPSPLVETPVPGLYLASPVEQDWAADMKMDVPDACAGPTGNTSSLAGALSLVA